MAVLEDATLSATSQPLTKCPPQTGFVPSACISAWWRPPRLFERYTCVLVNMVYLMALIFGSLSQLLTVLDCYTRDRTWGASREEPAAPWEIQRHQPLQHPRWYIPLNNIPFFRLLHVCPHQLQKQTLLCAAVERWSTTTTGSLWTDPNLIEEPTSPSIFTSIYFDIPWQRLALQAASCRRASCTHSCTHIWRIGPHLIK